MEGLALAYWGPEEGGPTPRASQVSRDGDRSVPKTEEGNSIAG